MVSLQDIRAIRLFDGLPESAIQQISQRLHMTAFEAGKTLFYRGEPGTSMFMIVRGSVDVYLTNDEGVDYTIATLGEGEVFGEMALLTGEPRSASVKVVSDLDAIEVPQAVFNELVVELPELNARLLRLLATRLGKTTIQQQAEHLERGEIVANLVSHQQRPEVDRFPGRTPSIREINEAIDELGGSRKNVLILGETGTETELVARLIHYRHDGDVHPFFVLDCADPPPVVREVAGEGSAATSSLFAEIAQEAALFGHEPGVAVHAKASRRGYLELADGGSLVLLNAEHLAPGVQERLCGYLESHTFTPMGSVEDLHSQVRIMSTTAEGVGDRGSNGAISPALRERLGEAVVRLKPLGQRPRDIPVLAGNYLKHFNRKAHKDIRGFTDDALNALVDYEWPLNEHELRQVVDRAVAICREERIGSQHIFLDESPFSARGRINLLRAKTVAKLVDHRLFPAVLRLVTVPFFLLLIVLTLLGPAQDNLGNLIVWTLWWPLLIVSTVIGARGWCGFCPVAPIGQALCLGRRRFLAVPGWLKKRAFWISTVGLMGIIWAEHATGMFTRPGATAVLLLAILGGAVLTTMLFGERIWCQYVCPLGQMLGQYATLSLVSLRSNSKVCTTQCQTHDCVKEPGCPMGLHPASARTSQQCILCLACVKNCTHKAVRLDARLPWLETLNQRKWEFSRAIFAVLVVASVLAVGASPWLGGRGGVHSGRLGLSLVSFLGILCGFVGLSLLASGLPARKGWKETFARCGHAYLPLALAGFFNIYFRQFVDEGHRLVPLTAGLLGLETMIPPSWVTPNLSTLKAVVPLITFVGSAVAFYMLLQIQAKTSVPRYSYRCHQFILLGTTLIFLGTL